MSSLDLQALDAALTAPHPQVCLARLVDTLGRIKDGYDKDRLDAVDWRTLVIPSPVSDRLHSTTRARLDAPTSEPELANCERSFLRVNRKEPDFQAVLLALRRLLTPYQDKLRTGPIQAEAGYTTLVAIFPPAERVKPALEQAAALRNAAPLSHPVWNTLLLYLLGLRIHPFRDGNGRTFRGLIAYEFWRAGLHPPTLLPFKRVLDANRANEIRTRTAVSQAASPGARVAATVHALCLDATLLRIAAEHAGR